MDYRRIEQELSRFFRGEGISASAMDGDLYLGVVTTQLDIKRTDDCGEMGQISVPKKPGMAIVSLTRLARELAEVTN
jgi:hypothetical protein